MNERRIARAPRRRPPPADPAELAAVQEAFESRGYRTPWTLARRLLADGSIEVGHWILHTADCPLGLPQRGGPAPQPFGPPEDRQLAFHEAGAVLAATIYESLWTEACRLCKPGTLLIEQCEDLRELWNERGRQ